MNPLSTTAELIDYQNRIQRQREVLKLSSVFAPQEKVIVLQIYNDLIAVCTSRINHLKDIKSAINL